MQPSICIGVILDFCRVDLPTSSTNTSFYIDRRNQLKMKVNLTNLTQGQYNTISNRASLWR